MQGFYPAENEKTADEVRELLTSQNLYCLHPDHKNVDLSGSYRTGTEYIAYDVMVVACASQIELYDGSTLGGDPTCEWNFEEFYNGIGKAFYIKAFHNQHEFMQDQYGNTRIEKKSKLTKIFSVTGRASWTPAFIEKKEVMDETDYL